MEKNTKISISLQNKLFGPQMIKRTRKLNFLIKVEIYVKFLMKSSSSSVPKKSHGAIPS